MVGTPGGSMWPTQPWETVVGHVDVEATSPQGVSFVVFFDVSGVEPASLLLPVKQITGG